VCCWQESLIHNNNQWGIALKVETVFVLYVGVAFFNFLQDCNWGRCFLWVQRFLASVWVWICGFLHTICMDHCWNRRRVDVGACMYRLLFSPQDSENGILWEIMPRGK
jgi:hypothetical protein